MGKNSFPAFQGSSVARVLAAQHSDNATFVHVNFAFPPPGFDLSKITLSELEEEGLRRIKKIGGSGRGYYELQSTKVILLLELAQFIGSLTVDAYSHLQSDMHSPPLHLLFSLTSARRHMEDPILPPRQSVSTR